jgi:DNA polymerase (family 10)
MTNQEIGKVFKEIAGMLELKKENRFKILAYRKVVRSIEGLAEPVEKLVREGRIREISGVGDAIEKKLQELVTTGHLTLHDKLKEEFPEYKCD